MRKNKEIAKNSEKHVRKKLEACVHLMEHHRKGVFDGF
jgi:hypothetical protein